MLLLPLRYHQKKVFLIYIITKFTFCNNNFKSINICSKICTLCKVKPLTFVRIAIINCVFLNNFVMYPIGVFDTKFLNVDCLNLTLTSFCFTSVWGCIFGTVPYLFILYDFYSNSLQSNLKN